MLLPYASGGQRQRISIARVILKNPPIIVLDEATSALSALDEYHINQALREMTKGRTVLSIAHRLQSRNQTALLCFKMAEWQRLAATMN